MQENMNIIFALLAGVLGIALGYIVRQMIAQKQAGSLERKIKKKIEEARQIVEQANTKAKEIIDRSDEEQRERKRDILKSEQLLLKREELLDKKITDFEEQEKKVALRVEEVKQIKERLDLMIKDEEVKLQEICGLSGDQAKELLLKRIEDDNQQYILERMIKLERESRTKYEQKAKEITALAIQRCALSQAQELTTTIVSIPNDEIKGRIIGKEGRNIRTFEELTGVELVVDDTPGGVVISGFDPIRRHVAKLALEMLIADGRIQPAKVEETVDKAKKMIMEEINKAGEAAVYDTQIIGLEPKLVQVLGRLKFRTSYGQNVLMHSIEVAHLSALLAEELGANVKVAKMAGLLHDIGKAIDFQIEGTHIDIGIKILEKFKVNKEIIVAMKSHHGDYPAESLEAMIVQAADQISGARPGARKDTLEQYIKRLEDLENIALAFDGVEKAYAIQAGRELRVFVNPGQINDIDMHKMARSVADRIEEELKYPGEIKVIVIRQNRVVEFAK